MKTQRFMIALTVFNLIVVMFGVAYVRSNAAEEIAPVLRGRSLEIVDEHGKVRAQILVTPPTTTPDGKYYAESALFRLIDPNGRPGVKIGTSVDGTGMSLAGDSEHREWSGVQILAHADGSVVKVTNKDGSVKEFRP